MGYGRDESLHVDTDGRRGSQPNQGKPFGMREAECGPSVHQSRRSSLAPHEGFAAGGGADGALEQDAQRRIGRDALAPYDGVAEGRGARALVVGEARRLALELIESLAAPREVDHPKLDACLHLCHCQMPSRAHFFAPPRERDLLEIAASMPYEILKHHPWVRPKGDTFVADTGPRAAGQGASALTILRGWPQRARGRG